MSKKFGLLYLILVLSLAPLQSCINNQGPLNANVVFSGNGGLGSGVVVRSGDRYYILTAYHVIANNADMTVQKRGFFISNEKANEWYTELNVELIEYDPIIDIAVFQIKDEYYGEYAKLYDGPAIEPGTDIYHIGNIGGPRGIDSISKGVVSKYSIYHDMLFLNTTCRVIPGSSGGGLYLPNGKLIAIVIQLDTTNGLGIAIPYQEIKKYTKTF